MGDTDSMKDMMKTENDIRDATEMNVDAGENANQPSNPAVQLLEALKTKLGDSLANSQVPKHLKRKVKALKKLQLEHVNLEAAFFRELHELEVKYEKMYTPLYEKRRLITTGAVEPTDEECDFPSDSEEEEKENNTDIADGVEKMKITPDSEGDKKDEIDAKDVKGIPEFWLTAFKSAPVIAEMIEEHDEPILKHLIDVKAITEVNPMGFYLEFYFEPNQYFSNTVLTKYYEMNCQPDSSDPFSFDGPEIVKCKGCTIDWKKGMNVTVKTIKKKQKHKARGAVRMVTKTVQNDSFFNFFNPPTAPDDDDQIDEETRSTLTADFEIGNVIKDRLVPQAVLYFTGENLVDDEFDEDDDEEDEEFEEEDDDSDEENEGRLVKKKSHSNTSAQNTQQQPQQQPPECKQQ